MKVLEFEDFELFAEPWPLLLVLTKRSSVPSLALRVIIADFGNLKVDAIFSTPFSVKTLMVLNAPAMPW